MQVKCVECKAPPFCGQDSFLDHMKTRHFAFSDDKYQYDCAFCHKAYSKKNFRRHFTSTHGHLFETPAPDVNPDCMIISSPNEDHPLFSDLDDNDLDTSMADVESASPSNLSSSPNPTSHSPLPSVSVNAAVQQVFDTCDSYWHELLARPDMTIKLSAQIHIKLMKMLELASELYKPYVDPSIWDSITNDINIEASKRSSQYLLMQNLQNNPNFVPPKACAISYRREIRTKQGVGQTTEIKSNNLGSIPIRDTLRNLFKSSSIADQLLFTSTCADPHHPLSADRSKQIFEKLDHQDSINLQLYIDDYGTANPLGYASATSKLMGCYFRVLNLPSKLQTSDTIFLSFLVLKNDVDNLQSVIRSVLLPQLLELEDNGINITVNGVSKTFPVILHSVVGDNAGIHELVNLMMSWTGNSPCRFCKLTYMEIKKACKVTPSKLKTKAWYDDLFRNHLTDLAKHGINGECALNELKFFNTMDTLCVDIMHDVFEGHLRCLLATTAQHLSKDGFSLKALNSAIAMFPFAGTMLDSKPGPIYLQDVKDGELKHSTATKTLNLALMLPLILHEAEYEIDISKPIWQTYLLFLEILDILLAHRITDGMLSSLESKTEKYLQLFISIGGKMTVKPHYLIHYPDVIRRHGPVIHHWCMRFEGKHKGFKQYARVNFNRQDLAMTLAKKHSLLAMKVFQDLQSANYTSLHDQKISRRMYKKNLVVVFNMDETNLPTFGRILSANHETRILKIRQLETIGFAKHLHSFKVQSQGTIDIDINADDLITYQSFPVYSDCFVRLPLLLGNFIVHTERVADIHTLKEEALRTTKAPQVIVMSSKANPMFYVLADGKDYLLPTGNCASAVQRLFELIFLLNLEYDAPMKPFFDFMEVAAGLKSENVKNAHIEVAKMIRHNSTGLAALKHAHPSTPAMLLPENTLMIAPDDGQHATPSEEQPTNPEPSTVVVNSQTGLISVDEEDISDASVDDQDNDESPSDPEGVLSEVDDSPSDEEVSPLPFSRKRRYPMQSPSVPSPKQLNISDSVTPVSSRKPKFSTSEGPRKLRKSMRTATQTPSSDYDTPKRRISMNSSSAAKRPRK
uniref:C2H2-type domain-containing protein n=1 Tax=Panagrellus redivivus TaxID=6233 RepID=A0A7E4ZUM2_PANRE